MRHYFRTNHRTLRMVLICCRTDHRMANPNILYLILSATEVGRFMLPPLVLCGAYCPMRDCLIRPTRSCVCARHLSCKDSLTPRPEIGSLRSPHHGHPKSVLGDSAAIDSK
jgi:hypothetical protein